MRAKIILFEKFLEKSLITVIILSLIFLPYCSSDRIERKVYPYENISSLTASNNIPYLKLHIKNGQAYVLSNWVIDKVENKIKGKGSLFDFNRQLINEGEFTIELSDIVLAETNEIKGSAAIGPLMTVTIITGIFTIVCIANPKACFGSCPTFYINDGSDYKLQAEGFSSSISPSLEEKDIDALYNFKPKSENLELQLRNEAYETHIIRSANILAAPKPDQGRVLRTPENKFFQVNKLIDISRAVSSEGDCSEKLCAFDGIERFSPADSFNLAEKEEIELSFIRLTEGNKGLVIASRQTLLTTFLFYQTLSYMGSTASYWFADLERNPGMFRNLLENPRKEMGGIEILVQNEKGKYIKVEELNEHGPIASDIQIVPVGYLNENSSLNIKLRMTKGLWRIDYAALADLGEEVQPVILSPVSTFPEYFEGSKVTSLLNDHDSVLVTFPGDKYFLNYKLPENINDYDYFLESQGYYLEWIRGEWLTEEDNSKVYQMFLNPKQYFKDLAPQFKKIELEMEETFWSSKYVLP